ncbi:MAG: hypothetical protein KAW12_06005 [Candidatus Aminicenantes bacterium]|nr:hypothetical protein [Candidatus Aminicenantes bacterium]
MNNKDEHKGCIVDRQHPYPGLFSFREQDKDYFFGRQREIDELSELIENDRLTVVFGKSGVGKTSLLRAGLIPKLSDSYYLPVYIRIDFDNREKSPTTQVKDAVEAKIIEVARAAEPFGDKTLWEYFSYVEILKGFVKPLLFFDQFEELFTSGKNHPGTSNEFITEIADLIENRVPVKVQERLAGEKQKIKSLQGDRPTGFRVIFSLREDYLPQLEALYKIIPSLRYSRFRVLQMQGKDALDAVLKPGKEIIKDQQVAVEIINKIPGAKGADYNPYEKKTDSWETKRIEPFLLSLFCYQVNEKRLEKNAAEISGELIKNISTADIIEDYYGENIGRFRPGVKIAIEDLLITAEGYRKLQDKNSLKTGYGITEDEITGLEDRRITRKEVRLGIDYIELIHDVLAPILKESRDKRQEAERQKKETAERKKKYSRIIFTVIGMAAIFMALLTFYAFKQKTAAEEAKAEVEKESRNIKAYELAARSDNLLDKNPTHAFLLAKSAYNTEKNNPDAFKSLLNAFYTGGFYSALLRHDKPVRSAGFTADGKYIVTVDRTPKTRCWDFSGRETAGPAAGKNSSVIRGTAEFRGRTLLITGDGKKTVRVLTAAGSVARELKGHTDIVNSAVFSPDGDYVVTASEDNTARLWDITFTKNKVEEFSGHTSERADFYAGFSPDGKVLTVSSAKAVLWNLEGKTLKEASAPDGFRLRGKAAFSAGGKYAAILTDADHEIGLWRLDEDQIVILKLEGVTESVAFSPVAGSTEILTSCVDNKARLWNLQGAELVEFSGHTDEVNAANFSKDGKYIVTAGWDKTARVWDRNGREIQKLTGHEGGIYSAVFSKNGEYILTAGRDGTARLWDFQGEALQVFEGHTGQIRTAVFSPGSDVIITAGDDKTVRLWNLNGIQVYKFSGFEYVIQAASYSPGGRYLLIAPAHGPAQLRLVAPGEILERMASATYKSSET